MNSSLSKTNHIRKKNFVSNIAIFSNRILSYASWRRLFSFLSCAISFVYYQPVTTISDWSVI